MARSMPHGHGPCSLCLSWRCLPQLSNLQLNAAGPRKPRILTPFRAKENYSALVYGTSLASGSILNFFLLAGVLIDG